MNSEENELESFLCVISLKVIENEVENPCLHLFIPAYLEQFPKFPILSHSYPQKLLFKCYNIPNSNIFYF